LWDPADLREDEPAWCYLLRRYQEMLEEGRPAVARTLEILARPGSYPAVFFCAAGKDRTGVLAALVLGLLGVPDEEIVSDYHLSGEPVARIVAQARSRESFMVEQPAALMACPPEAMRSTLAWIRDRYGSLEDYAGGADVGALRANLLEAA
jgi:protein-tyrosine phosphatase